MRKLVVYILLFFLVNNLTGQITYKKKIEWYVTKKHEAGTPLVDFKNAHDNRPGEMPYHYELIPALTSSVKSFKILGEKYELLPDYLASNLPWPQKVPDTIKYRHSMSTIKKSPYHAVKLFPFKKDPVDGRIYKLTEYKIEIIYNYIKKQKLASPNVLLERNSVLNSGYWYKIKIEEDGIYKLTYQQLKDLGIANPGNLRIYGNGGNMLSKWNQEEYPIGLEEIAIHFDKGSDGVFNEGDHVLFYGEGPVTWQYDTVKELFRHEIHAYSYYSYYYLTSSLGPGKTITVETPPAENANKNINTYDYYLYHEKNLYNLLKSGARWYGENFGLSNNLALKYSVPNLVHTQPLKIYSSFRARSSDNSTTFTLMVNSQPVQEINVPGLGRAFNNYAGTYVNAASSLDVFNASSGNLSIIISYDKNGFSAAEGWLDYFTINATSSLKMEGDQMKFRNISSVGEGNISNFTLRADISNLICWDITDHQQVKKISTTYSNGSHTFKYETNELKEFIAFNPEKNLLTPEMEGDGTGVVKPQNLQATGFVDYVMVVPDEFREEAEDLAALHRERTDLDILIVNPGEIYNEFSSGKPDIAAIRNFTRYLYDKASSEKELPQYLLLFGDGSYDNKTQDPKNPNYILTYQSSNSDSNTGSYVSDDYFGFLDAGETDNNGKLDIGIGRFPVKTKKEARDVVNKIKSYMANNSLGEWRNYISFIGDDEDGNMHVIQANSLATRVTEFYPEYNVEKIFLDAYQQKVTPTGESYPDVNRLIHDRMNKGCLVLNYTGHGNETGLAHEGIISLNDINNWDNDESLPIFVTATCEFSRFDDVKITRDDYIDRTSAGERVLLNPQGGGIALFTTTRLVYAQPNYALNKRFYEIVFEKNKEGDQYKLGDIMSYTKNQTDGEGRNSVNTKCFTLLGDPALCLAYPEYEVVVDSINNTSINEFTDTIKALDKIKITGFVAGPGNSPMENFNGTAFATLFDKPMKTTTLNNDNEHSAFSFMNQNTILYKGKATVSNGRFSFSFVLPKDINYQFGFGKLSLYARSESIDANGFDTSIVIGGLSQITQPDIKGPTLRLFMNDTTFISGQTTNNSPKLLALVTDENGINTSNSGIGHSITAVLDGDNTQTIDLNDFYEADKDKYTSGRVLYPFFELEEGPHVLAVKIWDTYNNSTEGEIEFIVASADKLVIEDLINFPNPFREETSFRFNHNKPDEELNVKIQIYNLAGKVVHEMNTMVYSNGFQSEPISFNKGDNSRAISQGIYIYKIQVTSEEGQTANATQRMLIVK
jgi:hypothetical protein